MPSQPGSGWGKEEISRDQVNLTFEYLEVKDEVRSDAPAFQPEEVELAWHFLICTRRDLSLVALQGVDPSLVVNVVPQVRGVCFYCILKVWPLNGTVSGISAALDK